MGYWAGRRERSGWPRSTPRTETISNGKEEETMIHFIGAGPGAADLITVRGARLLREADVIIYAGSLVNPALLENKKEDCAVYDSASMTLEDVIDVMKATEASGGTTVRLHTGDPSLYGAIREQMDRLDELEIAYDVTPGVSSFSGAAAALEAEYTLPEVSQSVIITRMAGRTPVPEREKLSKMASHGCTMVLFLSTGLLEDVERELMEGGYEPDTPAAIVYKATWPEQRVYRCTVSTLARTAKENQVTKTALITVGGFLSGQYERSKLYDPGFTHGYRVGNES
jgi:precorrin-4/cobalt-precorrin-4 C11-methyltransferase